MTISLASFEEKTQEAVSFFWNTRLNASRRQRDGSSVDRGERSAVTAGQNMDGFVELIKSIVLANGLSESCVFTGRSASLPGFFRPTKNWDVIVIHKSNLVAVVEFKSQVGPSFGNNFNNRSEEALGNAVDILTAFREGGFHTSIRPFIGFLMLLEDCEKSLNPVGIRSPHFGHMPEFSQTSYAARYELLCRKLVQENLYDSATLLMSPRTAIDTGHYYELNESMGMRAFVANLASRVSAASLL